MTNEDADKTALKKFLKQGVGILSPRLKELWNLFENIQTWKDDKEKEKTREFLIACEELLQFLGRFLIPGAVVRTRSGTLRAFPGSELLPDKIAAVVEAGAHVDWDKKPLDKLEISKLNREMQKALIDLMSLTKAPNLVCKDVD